MQLDPNDLLVIDCEPAAAPSTPEAVAMDRADRAVQARLSGVVIGKVAGWDSAGQVAVDYPGNPAGHPLPATTAAVLDAGAVGRDAALLFVEGDPRRPILVGLIEPAPAVPAPPPVTPTAQLDGKQLVFTAEEEIVFRCGQASITLTRAGKILIRGAYLLSRSTGVNRIKGGSVQIN